MRVHIGSDHAGFELKGRLVEALRSDGHEVVDHGPVEYDPEDDYPIFCIPTAEAVVADPGSLGIVIGGSGNGDGVWPFVGGLAGAWLTNVSRWPRGRSLRCQRSAN